MGQEAVFVLIVVEVFLNKARFSYTKFTKNYIIFPSFCKKADIRNRSYGKWRLSPTNFKRLNLGRSIIGLKPWLTVDSTLSSSIFPSGKPNFSRDLKMKMNTINTRVAIVLGISLLSLFGSLRSQAQEVDHSYKPLKLSLSEDGKKYVRFIMWHQFWATYTQNNPGTTNMVEEQKDNNLNFGLRRSRFLAFAQVSPRFLILTHFGINNQNFNNGGLSGGKKPQIYMHDAWTEFMVVPQKLYIGGGLHYWNGISRMTSASTLNFMTLDAPIFNWPNIELTDQFARQFGVYAKGALGKLHYQVALNKPFAAGVAPGTLDGTPNMAARNVINDNAVVKGYFDYQFFDQESQKLPYRVGTYMGGKKVFNIGAGFYTHADATISTNASGNEQSHGISLLAVDVFANLPTGDNGSAFTGYAVLYNYDFGPNYIRNVGIMNTAMGGTSFAGSGNRQPTIGTGNIFYTQLGYALPKGEKGQLQPFAAFTAKSFEALNEGSTQFDLGLNYFISGHNAKISLQYSTRPIYTTAGDLDGSRGELILQTHIFL